MGVKKTSWKTQNWLRIGHEVFMVQQCYKLYDYSKTTRNGASNSLEAFPTDNWRIVNLKDMVSDDDLMMMLEAREAMNDE